MADLTPEQAIEKLRTLPEDKQRAVLGRLSPEARKGILGKLTAKAPAAPPKVDAPQTPGFFKTLGQDLLGIAKPGGQNPYPGMGQEEKSAAATESAQADQARKKEGYSLPYRAIVPVAESIGVNVPGMEESARQGDVGGVLGHAAAVPVTIAGAKVAGAGLSKAGELRASAADRFGGTARKITGVEPALKEAVTKASDAHAEDLTEHAATSENVAKRGELEKTIDTQSKELHGHLSKVEQSVAKEANAKFDAVRAKIGNPEAPATELVSTVKNVEQNVLQNIPENIKEFRAIMQHEPLPEGIKNAAEAHGFDLEGTEPLTWEKLQSLKSRLDARLRKGRGMNGDLKRAIYQTRDAVVGEMGKMADANGASGEWGQARDFWRQYKEDFHEGTGPSGSGSPIAQALNAEDPKNIRQPFLRTQSAIGNRGVELLRKYPEHGGNEAAEHVTKIISGNQELTDLPNRPKGFSETPPAGPTVDASKVARDAIAQRAKNWGSFNARDIGIIASGGLGELLGGLFGSSPFDRALGAATGVGMYEGAKYYTSRALNNPKVVEWLSRTPAEEVAVLNKIPGADKVKIVNTLTDAAVSGKATNLSPVARQLLGPANVAKILAATGAGVVQNRREARERLGQPSN